MNWQTLIRQLIHPRACRRPIAGLLAGLALLCTAGAARADSWLFRPSTYSHDPLTGRRVNQYRPEEPAYVWLDPTYMRSGYRHIRMSFRGPGGSFDHTHIVQTWGAGEWIRPYGEWQFPFRAGATPYGPWGNPQGPWTLPYESWYNPYGLWNPYRWAYPVPYAPRGRRPGGAGPHHPGPTPYGPAPHSPFGPGGHGRGGGGWGGHGSGGGYGHGSGGPGGSGTPGSGGSGGSGSGGSGFGP